MSNDDENFLSDLAKQLEQDLAEFNKGTGGSVIYPKKDKRYTVRFLMPNKGDKFSADNRIFWQTIDDLNQEGKPTTNFLIAVLILDTNDENVTADKENVKYLKVPKTVLLNITAKLGANWAVFDPKDGPVFDAKKLGAQPWWSLEIRANKKWDTSKAVYPELSMEEAAKLESDKAINKQNGNAKPTAPVNKPASKGKVVLEEEDLPF